MVLMLSPLTTHWELIKVAMVEGTERVCVQMWLSV